MKCGNCGSKMSCGCQKRTASDGKQCCTSCIAAYEKSKGASKGAIKRSNLGHSPDGAGSITSIIISVRNKE